MRDLTGPRPVAYAKSGERTSPRWAAAFAMGCRGSATTDLSTLQPGPFAAFCTPPLWPLLRRAQQDGRDWYYGDHGYFRRHQYFRITKNAYQHHGRGRATADRFRRLHVTLHPWQTHGAAIVICPNSPVYMAFHGLDARHWALDLAERVSRVSDRPVVIRWKSQAGRRPFYHDLHDAWIVVTFSSAAAVEALAAGVPVCTMAPWASTAAMGITDPARVETPYYPSIEERDQFIFNLVNQQWTLEEMRQGLAWHTLHES